MILGFKQQFVEQILSGTKIHTIREDKYDRWKVGMKIQMATGVRTKNYKQFSEKICTGIQRIEIIRNKKQIGIVIDNKPIYRLDDFYKLSINDGFLQFYDFTKWFNRNFTGVIIHWTDLRY